MGQTPPRRRRRPRRVLPAPPVRLLAVLVVVVATIAPPRSARATPPASTARAVPSVTWSPPVVGPVVAGFAPGPAPWSAGHRGVDWEAAPGTPVRAMADGTVTFAGPVAGATWVTVTHADGTRTSYGHLVDVAVRRGQHVDGRAVVGRLGPGSPGHGGGGLHVGARRGGTYVDPLALLADDRPWRPALVGPGGWRPSGVPELAGYAPWDGRPRAGVVASAPVATAPGWELPPNANHVVAVAGLGTSSASVALDPTLLGFAATDVTHLSYAGRDAGAAGRPDDPRRDQLPYGPADVDRGVAAGARRLEAQLRAQWAREPGRGVDLVGHSMGGLVVLHYLLHRHDPADPGLPPIDHVVTLNSPHGGADLATAGAWVRDTPLGAWGAALVADLLATFDPRGTAARELATTAPGVDARATAWDAAHAAGHAGPLGAGTRVLTLAGQADLVVLDGRARLGDADTAAPHVVVPGGHGRAPRTEAALQVVRAFLAGDPVPGGDVGWSTVLDVPAGLLEQGAGAAVGRVLARGGVP